MNEYLNTSKKNETLSNWLRIIQIIAILLIIGMVVYQTHIFGLQQPKQDIKSFCNLNPSDNATCKCAKRMNAHVRFFDEFNTTPELLQIIRNGTWKAAYPLDTKVVEDVGRSDGEFPKIRMSNVSSDYYLTYYYEEVGERCIEAEAR